MRHDEVGGRKVGRITSPPPSKRRDLCGPVREGVFAVNIFTRIIKVLDEKSSIVVRMQTIYQCASPFFFFFF